MLDPDERRHGRRPESGGGGDEGLVRRCRAGARQRDRAAAAAAAAVSLIVLFVLDLVSPAVSVPCGT